MPNRIAILGSGGAGKSTLARALGQALDIPVIHLDSLYWHPGWTPTADPDTFTQKVTDVVNRPRWIIDGNFARVWHLTVAAADTVIFLDLPRHTCLLRIFQRLWKYRGRTRPDLPQGCFEKIDLEFAQWVWDFPHRERPKVMTRLKSLRPNQRAIVLKRPSDVEQLLTKLKRDRTLA